MQFNMSTEIIIAIISGIVAVTVAAISKTNLFSRQHATLLKDIELYNALPDSSDSKKPLLKFIDSKVTKYIARSTIHRRSGTDITLGIIFLAIGSYLTWFFINLGSWWLFGLLFSGFALLISIFGLVRGLKKVERDEKGNPV